MKNILVVIYFGFALWGCAKQSYTLQNSVFLPETVTQLKAEIGNPNSTQKVPNQEKGELLTYPTGTYQVLDGKITALLATANGSQNKLQYWLQQWKGQAYTTYPLETTHGVPTTVIYKNPSVKTSIIYSVTNDVVQKVIYEK